MITFEKVDFANEIDCRFNALYPSVSAYFVRMAEAIACEDEAALAKLIALAIIDLGQHGQLIAPAAAKWIHFFGKLPEFDCLTQTPSHV
jgi:hypothetical protein